MQAQSIPHPRLRLSIALAAMWLAACGGGGDGSPIGMAPAPADGTFAAATRLSVAPSLPWTIAIPTPQIWHSLAMNPGGDVLVAGEAPTGLIRVSSDGGATWTAGNSTPGVWISSAMSASGDRIVALQYGGGMFTSTDRGASWQRVTSSPLVNDPNGLGFEAVTVSQDGLRIAAVIQNGPIVLSHDGGATWSAGTLPDAPQNRWWRWIDGSADGSVLVAASHNGEVYLSSDAGGSWRPLTVAVGTPAAPVTETWYRVKLSADGNTIAIVANTFGGAPGTGIYVSHDRGASWTKGFSLVADYTFLAMSADGATIGATVSNTGATPGRVLLSTDGGASFVPLAMPGSDTDWRAIAMSADASRFAVAAG
ncbi:MAG: WD40/YVTN/BNR-like repeat-containing protein, partial [Ramlibacter sp.]